MNLAEQLRSTTRLDPSANALRQGERRVDYLALEMAAQRVATILRQQYAIAPGDRVAPLLPAPLTTVDDDHGAMLAAVACGAVVEFGGNPGEQEASVRVTGSGRFERVAPVIGMTPTAGCA